MSNELRVAIDEACVRAGQAMENKQYATAWQWLERLHILTQHRPLWHARSHWLMLRLGWQTGDYREVAGQIPRMIAALLFSRLWVPLGNNGRARVSAFAVMPVSDELHNLLKSRDD